ncbi:type I glyceraldehyde-3-phosphate dehydrogenase [Alicyclobacillus fastidiosus]|uniref:Glyceraldehyde-3-phosphate dehydrogenase n=1 Tax=Alicyclobacillus fastidiosus TaxID=392011 RepID=A0ABY6ZJS6_9BACL|nr:type I glyceraldehyde-3-phosphate dehydrogenase [Alicyclobacillus fastidiosus]WAH42742.1 type I glyceraldehyde-3-phosphate dehydrogenase [Alicyclobacillus fastidiosus]GMA64649.1 glyceraldehyde-3-phosphate dehydrogenase [Alicyclobacillus fastidiosus]
MIGRIGINGFGRIGRMVFRKSIELGLDVVAVNGTADPATLVHLVKYDSVHGQWSVPIEATEHGCIVNGKRIQFFSTRDAGELPWGEVGVDVVVEATGAYRTWEGASIHLRQGAQKVIITAPAKGDRGADLTVVMGVNHHRYHPERHHILSGASCTTNALAPVVHVLHETFGVESGLVTTVHAYTNDQLNQDNPHADLRRSRACAQSIIPTSTGAARAIGLVIPELAGRLNGLSVRVPTPNVSLLDVVLQLSTPVDTQAVNDALRSGSRGALAGVLGYCEEPLVSIDFNGDERSAVVDSMSTMVMGDHTVKVLAWYDNEWGYSCRIVDLLCMVLDADAPVGVAYRQQVPQAECR